MGPDIHREGNEPMFSRDYRDIVGGLLLVFLGLVFAGYAYVQYDLGTLRRMGPGMFPVMLGGTLALLGVFHTIPALTRPGVMPEIRIFSPLFVLAGCAVFALTLLAFGLVPAVIAITVVSSMAELEIRPLRLVLLSAALSLIAWLIFGIGFGLNLPMFRWPF